MMTEHKIKTNFFYQSNNKSVAKAIQRSLGMHLFHIRQKRKINSSVICMDLHIKQRDLDNVEIGREAVNWPLIQKLADYYGLHVYAGFFIKPE